MSDTPSEVIDEIERVQHVLELVRSALRDDLVPGSVLVPVLSHCVEGLMGLIRPQMYLGDRTEGLSTELCDCPTYLGGPR